MEDNNKTKSQLIAELEQLRQQVTDLKNKESNSTEQVDKYNFNKDKALAWLELSPVCTKIVDLDFNLQYMSPAGIIALEIEDIKKFYGTHFPLDFYPESSKTLIIEKLNNVIKTSEVQSLEVLLKSISGAELWFDTTFVPVFKQQQLNYIIIVSIDITKSKQTQNTLESFFEQPTNLHLIAQFDGTIRRVNMEWETCLGYSREELEDQLFLDLVHPDDLAATVEEMKLLSQGKKTFHFENRYRHKNGQYKRLVWSAVASFNEQLIYAMARDVSELEEVEKALRHSQKMDAIGQLTGGIAHDYNNMLGVIMGYTELLQMKLSDNSDVMPYLEQIEQASERGKSMTEKLLSFSRKQATHAEKIDIKYVISKDAELLAKSLTTAIHLKLDLNDDTWAIYVDPSDLQNMLLNMSINAHHAMSEGGTFSIHSQNVNISPEQAIKHNIKSGDFVLISIADTGMGMDPQTLSKVFEPFFSTKGENGTGLGLSQVYNFVKRSGGAIQVNSEIGKGAQFDIYFPRYQESAKSGLHIDKLIKSDRLEGNECILVVDDEAVLRAVVYEILSTHGYKVILAESGEQALDKLAEHSNIRLILSDVVMPNMNGVQLAEKVYHEYPHIAIQLVSGYTELMNQENDNHPLLKNLIHKPYRQETLLKRIRQLLDDNC